ncbi:xanthine dehydrogenase family protein molybdopterin-binding subunit [Teredinibacter haidensis]|uniref:xanthine dehydrogenase family protein molybdopterin-binding subunit n=1 Tax=Teredinibacter haidensis TaxID=2731755 RepID=UPI000948D7AD|nr:molybdopterin cofactor-binding domain-containing protein [Teredinibacter haidensis]
MSDISTISRRRFFSATGLSGGAFILAATLPGVGCSKGVEPLSSEPVGEQQLGFFVSIDGNGKVDIVCHRMEMGQGILTSAPQMIADELEADWSRVSVTLAKADPKYGNQSTGGSASIRHFFEYTRQMGAIARDMLEQAAAKFWDVAKSEVKAVKHTVVHVSSGKTLSFGELAELAGTLPVPSADSIPLKKQADFSLIGQDVKLVGQENIVQGKAQYAQDIQLPNMLIASIERPPVVGGKVKSFDATEAKKVAGVVDVIRLKDRFFPVNAWPVSGVAVLATNTWAALEGRNRLKIEWDLGANASHQSEAYKQELVKKVNTPGIVVRKEGDVYQHTYQQEQTLEATYTVPYHHHMSMETPAALAMQEGEQWVVWAGSQTPQWGKRLVLEELGFNPDTDGDKVDFNLTLMGGSFGRKGKNDFVVEAAELAKASGRPVKVVWSREDDVKHGFYHSIAANYYKAELTEDNRAEYWIQRVAHPPIGWLFNNNNDVPGKGSLAQSFSDQPFDVEHLSCETQKVSTHVRVGWLRSVQNINNAFAMGCFVDELAAKAGIGTREMWFNLLGEDRIIDLTKEGLDGWENYGQKSEAYALSTKRMKNTIDTVCKNAGIDKTLAENEGWGISYATSFNSYAAAATKVRVVDNKVKVLEMHSAIDCGIVVTPDRVKAQMEGAMIMGLSMALSSEITFKDGVAVQNNFHDYPVSRIQEVPPLFVHLVQSSDAPGGVGEPGLPPIMPSIVNAIYHASGKRIRDLPVSKELEVV